MASQRFSNLSPANANQDRSRANQSERQQSRINRQLEQSEQKLNQLLVTQQQYQLARSSVEDLLSTLDRPSQLARELEQQTSELIKARTRLRELSFETVLRAQLLQSEPASIDLALRLQRRPLPNDRRQELTELRARITSILDNHLRTWPNENEVADALQIIAARVINTAFDQQSSLATQSSVTFNAWTASTSHALVLATSRGGIAHFESVWGRLGESLQSLAPRLLEQALDTNDRQASLMRYSARLGDGGRMGVSVPLSYMTPGTNLAQQANQLIDQTLALQLHMTVAAVDEQTEVALVATGSTRDVRVRQALWDADLGAYRFNAEGPGLASVLWHPTTPPSSLPTIDPETGNAIAPPPIDEEVQTHFPGSISVPREPEIRSVLPTSEAQVDDYVITFPADSGIAPIYLILRNQL
ncbi:MAG: S-type pyocin domain-containing protein [Gammaproteobacteria bacterium]